MSKIHTNLSIFVPKQSMLFQGKQKKSGKFSNQELVFQVKKDRLAIVEASAGTGKTFALVELVLELILEQGIPLKKILIVTFTEKATNELKSRLRSKLQNMHDAFKNKDESLRKTPEVSYWEIDSQRGNLLKAALLDFDSAQIYTIHGFCKRILSEFAFENRQLFEQKFFDSNILFQEVFVKYIRKNILSKNNSLSKLFELYVNQNEVNLEKLREEILILINKDGHFVPEMPPFGDFFESFSKCWATLISQDKILRKQISDKHPILTAFEFTSINLVSKKKTFRNLDLLLKIISDSRFGASVLEILPSFFEIFLTSITNPKCNKVLKFGEKWLSQNEFPKAERIWMEALSECGKLLNIFKIQEGSKNILKIWLIQNILEEVRQEVSKTKLERGIFDFDDLLRIVEEELKPNYKKGTLTPLTKAVRKKYLCAVVDEFQDTDHRQWSIFSHLFLESLEHRLIVIGDPKQSIYSFRGADIFTYLKARKKIKEKTFRPPFDLKKNFRSTKKMICGINQIFSGGLWFPENRGIVYKDVICGNPKLKFKDNTSNRSSIHLIELTPQFLISSKKLEDYKKLKKQKISLDVLNKLDSVIGKKFFGEEIFSKTLISILGSALASENNKALLNLFLDDRPKKANYSFAESIALEIKDLLRIDRSIKERPVWKDEEEERPIMGKDICVLFRKSSEGEIIAKALRNQGIDFLFYKQKGLFAGREALEILDLLKAIENPSNYSLIGKLWLTRFIGVNINDLNKFFPRESDVFFQLKEWNSLAKNFKFGKLFENILNFTKLIERELFLSRNERSVTNYLHLFEFLAKQASDRHLNLLDLIQLLNDHIFGRVNNGENENLLRIESERDAVQLMTMHSSKGLEFPIVFLFGGLTRSKNKSVKFYFDKEEKQIIDMINTKIPEEYRWQEEAEQRRLLYVAVTRARGRLYLPYARCLSSDKDRRICKINGVYSKMNEQLSNIIDKNINTKIKLPFSFGTKELSFQKNISDISAKMSSNLGEWNPSKLEVIYSGFKNKKYAEDFFEKLRYEKKGFVVTSFSKLQSKGKENKKKLWDKKKSPTFEFRIENEFGQRREIDKMELEFFKKPHDLSENSIERYSQKGANSNQYFLKDQLSGGVQMGNLLHDLLEHTDFFKIKKSNSLKEWIANPEVHRFIESFNEKYGYSNSIVNLLAGIIWKTLRTNIKLGNNPNSPELELASIKKDLREVDFYFPVPNQNRKLEKNLYKNKKILDGCEINKGFLRGSIDLLFEHEGFIYLLDWKSNILSNYDQKTIKSVVLEHYELQLKIYTLATCYWFKLNCEEEYKAKFGGVIYFFLRGINNNISNSDTKNNQTNNGVYFKKPSWQEIKDFEINYLYRLIDY